MSYQTFIAYGAGVAEDSFIPTIEGVKTLLKLAPETRAGFDRESFDLDDLLDYSQETGQWNSYYGLFVHAIMEIENVTLMTAEDYDGRCYVMFPEMHPWNMTDEDKRLTAKSSKALMKKYLAMYCGENFNEQVFESEAKYLSIENGG